MTPRAGALTAALALALGSCFKVPIHGVEAGFSLADATWFAEEQTLFLFYEVDAQQGLGEPSVIEVTWATDDERVDWTPLEDLDPVHIHLPVDCGRLSRCGSASVRVRLEPREVGIRLRYHRDGELALDANTVFNVVGPGRPHRHRSLLVYGVFDETNQLVQWRSRHLFPTVRNERATQLGLRRWFEVQDQRYGTGTSDQGNNPYGYGMDCPPGFTPTDHEPIETTDRAVFHLEPLPLEASGASVVCATATVSDGRPWTFATTAFARKNPEVRSAFPLLRSPVEEATPLRFFVGPCDREISAEHEAMQRQRLSLEGLPELCADDPDDPVFVDTMVDAFRDAIEAERPAGRDMVLSLAVHRDDAAVAEAVEEALAQVVPDERGRSTPRVAGAFVFDSVARGLDEPSLSPSTLWCPSTIRPDEIPDASARSCATLPDIPDLELGPLSFSALPILPTRPDYLDFLDTYSEAQAGHVTDLTFLAPEFAVTSEHVDLGDFGAVTFLNGETLSADADDAFSSCVDPEGPIFVVRSPRMDNPQVLAAVAEACAYGLVPYELCGYIGSGLLPIEWLPDWHELIGDPTYQIGVYWEFPYLLRMRYESVLAGAVGAFGLTVPFGLSSQDKAYYGTETWLQEEFVIEPRLAQCRRFCDHPTFDSAGVYHVTDPFRSTYAHACYLPRFPAPGDSGFPLDP